MENWQSTTYTKRINDSLYSFSVRSKGKGIEEKTSFGNGAGFFMKPVFYGLLSSAHP